MIRNVVLGRLREAPSDTAAAEDRAQLAQGLDGIAALTLPGLLAMHVGPDLGLREGGWSFSITNDWADAEAYRRYDLDAEHNRHRSQIVAVCADVARVQFEL